MSFELQQQQQLRQLGRLRNNQAIIGRRRLRLRQDELQIERAQGQHPGTINENTKRLEQTRDYMRRVREAAAREKGQRKDIDSQVMGQKAKIREAALDLAQQATKARRDIGNYSLAALEQKKLAIQKYQYAVNNWWDNAIRGLKEAIDKQQDYIDLALMRSMNSMRKAILFGGSGFRKGVIYHNHKPMSEGDRYPNREGINSANERIVKIADASQKQEGKIKEQEGKILDAYASLAERQRDAYRRLDATHAKRREQFASLKADEKRIIKHEDYLKKRGEKIKGAAAQTRQRKAQLARGAAQTRRGIARTRRTLAQLSRNKALVDANKAKANSFIAATNAGTKMAMPRFHPAFIQWMKKNDRPLLGRLRKAIKKQKTLK